MYPLNILNAWLMDIFDYSTDMTINITNALTPHQWIFSLQFRTTNLINLLLQIAINKFLSFPWVPVNKCLVPFRFGTISSKLSKMWPSKNPFSQYFKTKLSRQLISSMLLITHYIVKLLHNYCRLMSMHCTEIKNLMFLCSGY